MLTSRSKYLEKVTLNCYFFGLVKENKIEKLVKLLRVTISVYFDSERLSAVAPRILKIDFQQRNGT